MADRFADEQFSAYLDGEATAVERAAVDERLEKSASARQLLAELAELSRELQALPREECPADFANSVMRAVAAGMSEPVPRRAASGSRRAGLLRSGAVLAATALVALSLLNPHSGTPLREVSSDSRSAEFIPHDRPLVRTEVRTTFKKSARPLSDAADGRLAKRSHLGNEKDSAARKDALVPPIALGSVTKGAADSAQGLVFVDNLRKLSGDDVGRVLTAIEHSPSGISVVKLTVIDCRHGLDALQVLLSRNRIPPQHAAVDAKSTESQSRSPKDSDSQRLVAVYVQSSPDRLASVMSELRSNAQFRRLQVDPPISPRRLDPIAQRQIAMLDALGREGLPAEGGGKGRGRFAFGTSPGNRSQGKPAPPAKAVNAKDEDVHKKSAPGENGRRDKFAAKTPGVLKTPGDSPAELDRISRQLQLTVPAGVVAAEAKGDVAQRSMFAKSAPQIAAARRFDGKNRKAGGKSPTAARPLRVLFVLVCPPGSGTPAVPAARKSGS